MNYNFLNFSKKLERFIVVPLYTIDYWLVQKFYDCNKIEPTFCLPEKIRNITIEQYESVRNKILEFRSAALNNQNAELRLTANEIDYLHIDFYAKYSQTPVKQKKLTRVCCYEIQNNEIIEVNISCNVYFYKNRCFYTKEALQFNLENGFILESRRYLMAFDQEINYPYIPVKSHCAGDLIYFILKLQHVSILYNRDIVKSEEYTADAKIVKTIVQKLKSIGVENNRLILRV
jgi:hypothetical protein